jgi:hypothetical protein
MGFLDRLFGGKKDKPEQPPAPQRRHPSRSIISEKDLKTLADLDRYYPLPEGFEYHERQEGDFVVVRKSDSKEYIFLVEEGILSWDDPYTREDGRTGYKTTEVPRRG